MKFCWHKWVVVRANTKKTFLGVSYIANSSTEFIRCTKCKRVKQYFYDSQGGSWSYLSEKELEIFNEKFGFENDET